MATFTVPFEEMTGSPTSERRGKDGTFEATRQFKCAWGHRLVLANQFLGYTAGIYSGPHLYPDYALAYAVDVSIAPLIDRIMNTYTTPSMPTYEHAVLTVNYRTREPGTGASKILTAANETVIVEESIEATVEALTLSNKNLFWEEDFTQPLGEIEAGVLSIRMLRWHIAVHNIITETPNLNQHIGKVNDQPVSSISLGETFGAACVLFAAFSKNRIITDAGPQAWRYNFLFLTRPYSWNKFYKAGKTVPEVVFKYEPTNPGTDKFNIYNPYDGVNFRDTLKVQVNQ